MAYTYNDNELFTSVDRDPFPRIKPDHAYPKTLGPIATAPELEVGTPMAYDTDNDYWIVWSATTTGDAETIRGFIYPEPVQTHASNEVMGIVMVAGEIHFDDIILPTGEAKGDLRTACRSGPHEKGLYIRGLRAVR